ncbi:MAG: histone deacetylase [Anaerolineales bacterium]|jgi:acetoin utilization deacetylase AcuC-like enzyme
MKCFYSDDTPLDLPPGHRFPAEKYSRLRERLLEEGVVPASELLPSQPATDEQLLRVHTRDYLDRLVRGQLTDKEIRRIGFPWSPDLAERARRSTGGTIMAGRSAMRNGVAANLAGGTHHAHPDFGAGFCTFNDVAVAARELQHSGLIDRILVLDCDVHQGDGTARIFQDDSSVYTFSIHGRGNFPFNKAVSDLDVALPDGTGDDEYLIALEGALEQCMQEADADLVFYLAGADPYKEDSFGRMGLTKTGLAERDRLVLNVCRQVDLPVAITMAGGYARNIEDIVEINLQTIRAAIEVYEKSDQGWGL